MDSLLLLFKGNTGLNDLRSVIPLTCSVPILECTPLFLNKFNI